VEQVIENLIREIPEFRVFRIMLVRKARLTATFFQELVSRKIQAIGSEAMQTALVWFLRRHTLRDAKGLRAL